MLYKDALKYNKLKFKSECEIRKKGRVIKNRTLNEAKKISVYRGGYSYFWRDRHMALDFIAAILQGSLFHYTVSLI